MTYAILFVMVRREIGARRPGDWFRHLWRRLSRPQAGAGR